MDIVQVLKRETAALGGDAADEQPWDSPIEPEEDALEAAGLYLQDADNRDETTLISRAGLNMLFEDGANPSPKSLSDLIAGTGGLTEAGHKALRHLAHFMDDGPADGFTSGMYKETLPPADPFPTSEIWYNAVTKAKKIVELVITRNANKTPATEVWKLYEIDGSTVLITLTDTITYSGVFETSRVRAWV